MPENLGYRYRINRLLVGGACQGEDLNVAEEGKVLEEVSLGVG